MKILMIADGITVVIVDFIVTPKIIKLFSAFQRPDGIFPIKQIFETVSLRNTAAGEPQKCRVV